MFNHVKGLPGVDFHLGHEVEDFRRKDDGIWRLKVRNLATGESRMVRGALRVHRGRRRLAAPARKDRTFPRPTASAASP